MTLTDPETVFLLSIFVLLVLGYGSSFAPMSRVRRRRILVGCYFGAVIYVGLYLMMTTT